MRVECEALPSYQIRRFLMAKYFKKPSGIIIEATENHDFASLKDRFEECDANGKAIKKATKKGDK